MFSLCVQLVKIIIIKPQKVLKIKIPHCSAKNFARRPMDAALGALRLRPKSVQLEKVLAMLIIRKIFPKKELNTEILFTIINNIYKYYEIENSKIN